MPLIYKHNCIKSAIHSPIRVRILGAESVGKTELSKNLAAAFGGIFLDEFAREVWPTIRTWDPVVALEMIMQGQAKLDTYNGSAIIIQDTTCLSTISYIELFDKFNTMHKTPLTFKMQQAYSYARKYSHYDLTLILSPDAPFIEDGVRGDTRNFRNSITDININRLQQENAPYYIISGDWNDRFKQASELLLDAIHKNILR